MRTKSLKKNKINVVTLGCSKNVYDSEVLMGQLRANNKEVVHEEEGNVVVNKESSASNKLMARRAIEAHLERKTLEKDLDEYYFEGI